MGKEEKEICICVGCKETTTDLEEDHWYDIGGNNVYCCEFCHLETRRV